MRKEKIKALEMRYQMDYYLVGNIYILLLLEAFEGDRMEFPAKVHNANYTIGDYY